MDKREKALAEYRRKLKAGEIEPPKQMDPIEKAKANPKSLRAAINGKCFDCCCGQKAEVARCTAKDCTLWGLRPWQGMAKGETA